MKMIKRSCSWRYGVMGRYQDRDPRILHIYPLPFIRLTFERKAR